ncbi:hypothetical protein BpHYR1_024857 [Brachionus plicatilis]|uniref:Uncharacterized protein n=1 Tax=Brachionus plicatilis TaxID=10195 RepID=A0A3M7RDH8_BRAPC|nr:hypothetical protein BpHYR1_024857 [Brachionus plicatilis]
MHIYYLNKLEQHYLDNHHKIAIIIRENQYKRVLLVLLSLCLVFKSCNKLTKHVLYEFMAIKSSFLDRISIIGFKCFFLNYNEITKTYLENYHVPVYHCRMFSPFLRKWKPTA